MNQNLASWLVVMPGIDTVMIENEGEELTYLGVAGARASVAPGEIVHSFSLTKERDHGLIAIARKIGPDRKNWSEFFTALDWTKEKPVLKDLIWVPSAGRLGQVFTNGIEVTTPEFVYGTRERTRTADEKEYRIVRDPNLLCRFLIGQAEVNDLDRDYYEGLLEQSELQVRLAQHETEIEKIQSAANRAYNALEKKFHELQLFYSELVASVNNHSLTNHSARLAESQKNKLQ